MTGLAVGAAPRGDRNPLRPTAGAGARLAIGAAILAILVWRLDTTPFLDAWGSIDGWPLLVATVIAVPTTVCSAWRWRLVSRAFGTDLAMGEAVGACYRSQFLNTVLPGGVLGDVHRAVRRGRTVGDVGHGVRSVVWERAAGQVVQAVVTVAVLAVLPSPVRPLVPVVVATLLVVAAVALLVGVTLPHLAPPRLLRLVRGLTAGARQGLSRRRTWSGVVLASVLVLAGHTATLLVAARAAGSTASPTRLLPLALLMLLAAAVPTNIAGWGPREGGAAWVFAVAGLGAAQGVTTAVVYGVMVLVATLPGAALLARAWLPPRRPPLVAPTPGGAARG